MLNETNRRKRKEQARERLAELRERGFRYLVTRDDGASWTGSTNDGIEIEVLLGSGFVGNVVVADSL